ncbi:hypothetical protein AB0L68_36535 [Streptomyces sp. NPDC052164]|uniref:hypothetical protein n=1 Tax=Streptomyces sp. NPDC052164 TaxID=3155529 RepID=UPI00343F4271
MPLVTLAGDVNWAEALSAIAAPLGVAASLLACYWAFRAVVPKRRVVYSIEFTPLLSSTYSGLTVNLGAERLAEPQTATLKVTNLGNREIEVEHFNGEAIEFEMNARVVSVLTSESSDNRRVPPAAAHGNALQIDPYVIHRKQEISYKLLLDGRNPRLSLQHNVSAQLHKDKRQATKARIFVGTLVPVLSGVIAAGLVSFFHTPEVKPPEIVKDLSGLCEVIADDGRTVWYQVESHECDVEGTVPDDPTSSPSANVTSGPVR